MTLMPVSFASALINPTADITFNFFFVSAGAEEGMPILEKDVILMKPVLSQHWPASPQTSVCVLAVVVLVQL